MKLSFKIVYIVFLGVTIGILATHFLIMPAVANQAEILQILIIFVAAAIPSALIVWFLIHKLIINPIINLTKISKIIASGNLSERVNIKTADEIGELAQNFNTIINNLTSGMQTLANSLGKEKRKEKELANNYMELDKEKAKDEALLTSIGDGVIAIDHQKKIILFNEAASKMIGIDSAKVIDQPYDLILKLQDEKTHQPVVNFINNSLQGKESVTTTRLMLQRVSGEMLPVLPTISPIFDSQKKITGVVIVLKDITWERELEKLKDEFVSLASHELRTPMTAIKGLISMIFEGDYGNINDGLRDPLSDIAKSTDRLIQLVNDMLDVSRIEAGRMKFTLTEVSISDLISEVVTMLKPLAVQKNIQLGVKGPDTGKIMADADKVKQILINLVSNAIKFTDYGFVTISFRPWGKFAYISVVDSGIGITGVNQAKLFGKFAQISTSQLGRPVGTGLGLYLSREFTRRMGGELWLEHSETGRGSTFTFALPLTQITQSVV